MLDPCRVLFSTPMVVKNGIEQLISEKNISIECDYKAVESSFSEVIGQTLFDIAVISVNEESYEALLNQITSVRGCNKPLFERFILIFEQGLEVDYSAAWTLGMCGHVAAGNLDNLYCCLENYADLIAAQKKTNRDLKEASDIALLSMSAGSELGDVLRFMQKTFECESFESLAAITAQILEKMGFETYGLLKTENNWIYFGAEKEEIVWHRLVLHFRQAERFIDLPNKTVVNFSHISILARNMPEPSTEAYGNKKELLFKLAEGVNARAIAIGHELLNWESDQARNVFMSLVSHELRTPMNAILGFSHYLNKKDKGDVLTERDLEALSQLDEKSDDLLKLITSLLEISEIQSEQKVMPKRSILRDVFFQSILNAEKESLENGLGFEVIWRQEEIVVDTDVRRIKHIVEQLLSNAIKFTCEGHVQLEIGVEGKNLELNVTDTGVGISELHQKQLFTPFSQLNTNVANHHSGLGIGLAIACQFCKDLQGTIQVTSEVGKGSRFHLELPLILIHYEDQVYVSDDESELF